MSSVRNVCKHISLTVTLAALFVHKVVSRRRHFFMIDVVNINKSRGMESHGRFDLQNKADMKHVENLHFRRQLYVVFEVEIN